MEVVGTLDSGRRPALWVFFEPSFLGIIMAFKLGAHGAHHGRASKWIGFMYFVAFRGDLLNFCMFLIGSLGS
jgi:hypothetical protein